MSKVSKAKTLSECDLLIIGNGFAGRTVAGNVKKNTIIVERGEKIDIFDTRQRYLKLDMPGPRWKKRMKVYESKLPFNTPEKFGKDYYSQYSLVDGGCSNHWDGVSFRFPPSVFDDPLEGHEWPFSYSEMVPYYSRAEQILRLSADPEDPDNRNPVAFIEGGDIWRKALHSYFPSAYLAAQAHNLSPAIDSDQGQCQGAGDCKICPFDAKTRSAHLPTNYPVINETLVKSLVFDGDSAIRAVCENESGSHEIFFKDVVVAAHGVESPKILWNSQLPERVPQELFGKFYQDHAIHVFYCRIPNTMLPYNQANTACPLIIPELSGEFNGIKYFVSASISVPSGGTAAAFLDLDLMNDLDLETAIKKLGSTMFCAVLLEVPPKWNVSMSYSSGKVDLDTSPYHKNKSIYGEMIQEIYSKMGKMGVEVIEKSSKPHYGHVFGLHHIMGTLNMSKGENGVVDEDFKLKGTSNVYVAGSSLFPRSGSRNPTLTLVALSLKLADQLRED